MSNKTYDNLKLIALLALPIGTFISNFFDIWGIGYAEQIHQTFVALDVLLGVIVVALKMQYDNQKENSDGQ